jgi:glutamyl-tRNA synthetase
MTIRTRIAPSPTGPFHIGTARTALFNYLFAKKHGGLFIVRIEDTDKERSKPVYETDILEQLLWLNLNADETYRQSEHLSRHAEVLRELVSSSAAYVSNEQAKDGSGREVEVVRLHNPGAVISFKDLIRGTIQFDTAELGDFVIARSITDPLYHLAVVVDDEDEGITHVIRGEDHISNTQRQILIQRALGYREPAYAHLPLILAQDRSKLSKRRHAVSIAEYRRDGYLSTAIINYLALLGWHPEGEGEILSMQDIISQFDIERIQKGGAIFDVEKLKWFNRQYLLQLSKKEQEDAIVGILSEILKNEIPSFSETVARRIVPIIVERVSVWDDVRQLAHAGDFHFYFMKPALEKTMVMWKNTGVEETRRHLEHLIGVLGKADEDTYEDPGRIKEAVWSYAEKEGRGHVLWPFRYALTGREKSPDPFTITAVLGKEETLLRLNAALDAL